MIAVLSQTGAKKPEVGPAPLAFLWLYSLRAQYPSIDPGLTYTLLRVCDVAHTKNPKWRFSSLPFPLAEFLCLAYCVPTKSINRISLDSPAKICAASLILASLGYYTINGDPFIGAMRSFPKEYPIQRFKEWANEYGTHFIALGTG
ncbi:13254_t:CDS:2, partial [Acaulospora colombiana]